MSSREPEPRPTELWCARSGCPHPYPQHPDGPCLWWDPASGDHCGCPGFLYVPPGVSTPPPVDATPGVCA